MPVLVLFWAEQMPPSVQAKQQLESLMTAYEGKLALADCDVAVDQTLAQHLQVRSLPALRVVHQGKIVDQMDGPFDDSQLRALLDGLSQSPADLIKAQLEQVIAAGEYDQAVQMLQQAVQEEPGNLAFRVELADVLVRKGDLEDARTVLASVPEDTDERERPQNRLEFIEEVAGLSPLGEAVDAFAASPDDLECAYQASIALVVDEQYEAALEAAMTILRADREFRDDIGRLTMIRIFALLGKGHELSAKYRRKMFNFMH